MKNIYWAALQSISGIGNKTLYQLADYFQDTSGEKIFNASATELEQCNCLKANVLAEFLNCRKNFSLESLQDNLLKFNVQICTRLDENYPASLREIFDPPFLLYYRGTLKADLDTLCIAIVGSRIPTAYGAQIAQSMAQNLAKAGFTIVSGAAKGIDTKAHIGALKAQRRTIAVLGCGLDIAYPAENRELLNAISQNGAVISEYPLGTLPIAGHFPARNRIINGIAKGILVVEAAKKSGSLITAELALSEGRDVFAIPGNIYSAKSQGCHKLIQQGAKLVTDVGDIIEEYQHDTAFASDKMQNNDTIKTNSSENEQVELEKENQLANQIANLLAKMTREEKLIYEQLSFTDAKSADEIIYKLRMNVSNIAFILLQMKLKGLIKETSPNFYTRAIRECFE